MADPASVEVEEAVASWRRRLEPHKRPVVYTWSALAFQSRAGTVPGLAVWAMAVGFVLAVVWTRGSLVYVAGVTLLLVALGYFLVAMTISTGKDLYPQWSDAEETELDSVCQHLSVCGHTLSTVLASTWRARSHDPKRFYVTGLGVAFALSWAGDWVPASLLVWACALTLLLLPPALSRGWLTEESRRSAQTLLRQLAGLASLQWARFLRWAQTRRYRRQQR